MVQGSFDDTVLYVDGQPRQFTLIKQTKLEIQLTQKELETGGYIQIKAYNPPPGGGESKPTTLTVLNPAPVLTSISPSETKAGGSGFTLTLTGNNLVKTSVVTFNNQQYPTTYINPTQIEAVIPAEAIQTPGEYTVTVTNPAPGGGQSEPLIFRVTPAVQPLPEGTFGKQYEDLIPTDATIQSYDPERFSIITGLVKDRAGSPLQDVTVSIHNHPEYGTAQTDSTGRFSIPVEGGGTLTVVYKKANYITVHRKVYVPWNDIATTETITMLTEDTVSTTVTFDGNPSTIITHRSSTVTDEYGSRSLTMGFTGDNRAFTTDENGNQIELTTITTRATEFDTPESMPAKLHPHLPTPMQQSCLWMGWRMYSLKNLSQSMWTTSLDSL